MQKLATTVAYAPSTVKTDAKELQKLLNQMGANPKLDEDGKAGKNTSDALKKVTGKLLKGDPRS